MVAKGKLLRMDNILIVVDDLEAAKAFFAELGLELEGEATVEGPLVGETDRAEGCGCPSHSCDDAPSRRSRGHRVGQIPHAQSDQVWTCRRAGEYDGLPSCYVRRR